MKIAFIVTEFPALSETFILNQITGLLDLGHDVDIFAKYDPFERKIHPDIKKYDLMKRVNYFFNGTTFRNMLNCMLKAIYLVITNFHKNPLRTLKSINLFKYGKNTLSLVLLYSAVSSLNKQYDVIHCHFGQNGIIGAQLKEIGIQGKLITTFYGGDLTSFLREKGEKVYNNLFVHGDLFLPICDYFRKKLISMKCDENKIIVHHLGSCVEGFPFSLKKIAQNKPLKLLTISRLVEKKGHKYALAAFAKIVKSYSNLKYIIAGGGSLRTQLEQLVMELNLSDKVKFTGAVNALEVKALFQEAHIFILPSITAHDGDQEGTPTVLVEAQACGLPVISTLHSGIPELVVDGKSGFLVPEKDIDALTDKMEYLIKHPELMSGMGSYGRKYVEENYNTEKLNRQLVNIYYSLVHKENDMEKIS